jgi:hypothetical protein
MVKALQQLAHPRFDYPTRPTKRENKSKDGNPDPDAFEMAVFTWKEDYKAMRA